VPALRGYQDVLLSRPTQLKGTGDEALIVSHFFGTQTIRVGGINEGDPGVERGVDDGDALVGCGTARQR
jgi:hypothetical protein